jgi:hypothetical protein
VRIFTLVVASIALATAVCAVCVVNTFFFLSTLTPTRFACIPQKSRIILRLNKMKGKGFLCRLLFKQDIGFYLSVCADLI